MVERRTRRLGELNEFLAREIEERQQAEKALRRSVDELEVLGAVSKALTTTPDLRPALERVTELVTHRFGAQFTLILVPSSDDTEPQIAAGFKRESGAVAQRQFPVVLTDMPQTQRVLNSGESLILPDVQSMPHAAPMREYLAEHNVQSVILVPLLRRGSAIGVMAVASDRSGQKLTMGELNLAETIAGDVAVAVENARLAEEAQSVALTEERDRLARDLHDAVTQSLFSASLIAEALPGTWQRDQTRGRELLDELRLLSRGALAEMRTLLLELRPTRLLETDLVQLLQQLAQAAMSRQVVSVEVTGNSECPVRPDLHIALYRIAQEALNNAVKHAAPSRVEIHVECELILSDESQDPQPQQIKLTVSDDGRGFDPEAVRPDHLGLSIIQERADLIGARLTIDSKPGHGTRISVFWEAKQDELTNGAAE
jgi:signal transduction histidine kinase